MPKPKSPERPHKRMVESKIKQSSNISNTGVRKGGSAKSSQPRAAQRHSAHHDHVYDEEIDQLTTEVESIQLDERPVRSEKPLESSNKVYPTLIRELLSICIGEASDVRGAFKNRSRQKYKNIFESYKDKLSERDYSIIKGALFYLYDFSRVNSIDKESALWMIGIYEIPTSQIVSYTSKEVLKNIAKDHGLSYSNKKAERLVESIRCVIDPSH